MGDSYIQISSNLINQLATDQEKPKKKTRKPRPKSPQKNVETQKTSTMASNPPKSIPSPGWPLQPPMFLHVPSPPSPALTQELETIKSVVQESERVLEKLEKQEAKMTQKLTQRAKELREKEFKLPYQNPIPCVTEMKACSECYQKNVKEPRQCAEVVKAYKDCVRMARSAPAK